MDDHVLEDDDDDEVAPNILKLSFERNWVCVGDVYQSTYCNVA